MNVSWLLLAEMTGRLTFGWRRIETNSDWILPVAVCILWMVFVRWMYQRDARELRRGLGWLLTILRTAAIFALLLFYLQPQWRTEHEEEIDSRVLVLIDTSTSMDTADATSEAFSDVKTRAEAVAFALSATGRETAASGDETEPGDAASEEAKQTGDEPGKPESDDQTRRGFLDRLREVHDVTVVGFDVALERKRTLAKFGSEDSESPAESDVPATDSPEEPLDWNQLLRPRGDETRLGEAIRSLIEAERSTVLSAVILFGDGRSNAGIGVDAAVDVARDAKIPVHTVGVGSKSKPTANVAVSSFQAPERVYAGAEGETVDDYTVNGVIKAEGMTGKKVLVELLSRPARDGPGDGAAVTDQLEDSLSLTMDEKPQPVTFTLTPEGLGRRILTLRVKADAGDANPEDNQLTAEVEAVDRKNRILLLAGGPTREYRFLRNQLRRDGSATVDVLLQTAQVGISQDADDILDEFPPTAAELFEYDCIIAIDPDWKELGGQIELIEQWVAQQAGGLIVIAGPVHVGEAVDGWLEQGNDPAMAQVRALYPVVFKRSVSLIDADDFGAESPGLVEFTREGLQAEFLRLGDTNADSQRAWAELEGVYGCCAVRGPKRGATVYAYMADPATDEVDSERVFFAGHFYGSGRVFYLGSGEMWRLRAADEAYFEKLYTQLIRHVSQGRLRRGSSRGSLDCDKKTYLVHGTVEVRAQLTDAQFQPLVLPPSSKQVVPLRVVLPDGTVQSVGLEPVANWPGVFVGRFPALRIGRYRLELSIPQSNGEVLAKRIQVTGSDLESSNTNLDDEVLISIAEGTGGKSYFGVDTVIDPESLDGLLAQIEDRKTTKTHRDEPNQLWEKTWLKWVMFCVCGLLCIEWLIRRLARLA